MRYQIGELEAAADRLGAAGRTGRLDPLTVQLLRNELAGDDDT